MKNESISIISMPPSGVGGSQTYAKLLEFNLKKSGFKINQIKTYYVTYNWLIPKEILFKILSIFINIIKLSNLLKIKKKQIVHLYLGEKFSYWENAVYALTCMANKTPFIYHIHTNLIYDEYSNATIIGKKIREYLFAKSSKIIVLSNILKTTLSKMHSFPTQNTKVVHNFVDVDIFNKYSKTDARKECSLPLDKKIVFGLGRLIKDKNFTNLILAIEMIRKEKEDIYCIIGGSGIEENNLKTLIKSKQLEEHVILLGEIEHKNVPLLLSASDVFAIPSFTEAFPMVILEALASGRPVVGANVGAIPEILSTEEYGLLVNPNKIEDISKKIMISLDKKWDEQNITLYCREFFSNTVVKKIIKIYIDILNQTKI